ncbi:MAG: AsnC family transcriptional regulator [Rhodocyclaceae bacterium]|nr:AsnC family transcriptional regulator [Rhodocyclaceae bacterium]
MPEALDALDRALINALHGGFPLSDEPFREVGARLGLTEADCLERLRRLLGAGVLSRFGPLFQVERLGGVFVLAAMQVAEADFDATAAVVNGLPAVAHNYRREHAFNMWFVLATETPAEIDAAVAAIERIAGTPVYVFPKEREYFIGMRLEA